MKGVVEVHEAIRSLGRWIEALTEDRMKYLQKRFLRNKKKKEQTRQFLMQNITSYGTPHQRIFQEDSLFTLTIPDHKRVRVCESS